MDIFLEGMYALVLAVAVLIAALAYAARQAEGALQSMTFNHSQELGKAQMQIEHLMGKLKDIIRNNPDYNVNLAIENVRKVMADMPFKKVQKDEMTALISAADAELTLWLDSAKAAKDATKNRAQTPQKGSAPGVTTTRE